MKCGLTTALPRPVLAGLSALAVLGAALTPLAAAPAQRAAAASCPWVGSAAPIAQRVSQLEAQMTIPDEIALVHGTSGNYVGNVAANPALCIPALNLQDGPAGVGDYMSGVTQLPAPVAAAATWDTGLEQQYGTTVGAEDAGKGVNVDLGPTINIVRDARWGRAVETFGEDPYLNGQMGAAYIKGVQSQNVLAMVKHYAVYNQETNRNTPADNAIVDPRPEQEIYLPAFDTAVNQGGAASVMCSYSTINGAPACDDPALLNTVLKGQFGFNGFVASDWGATKDGVQSGADGLDMQMPDDSTFGAPLQSAVQNGTVPKSVLDGMVTRILTEMFRFGLFDNPSTGSPAATVTSAAHAATAQQVATDGTVLLKNSGNVLPLDPAKAQSVAIIGDDATPDAQTEGAGSAGVVAPYVISPLQGISDRLTPASPMKVTASTFSASNSVGTETTSDTGGGQDVGYINNSSWLEYPNVNFGSGGGATEVQARLATAMAGYSGDIQFRLDSATATPFASIQVTATGGWQNWATSLPVAASPRPTGTHTLYVTFSSPQSGNFVNVNWFSFGAGPGITARYAQGATASGQMPALSAGSLTPAQGGGQGLYAQYYNNMTLSGSPAVSEVDQNYNDNFNGLVPLAGVNAAQWSARWTGTFTPSVTGTYYFSTTSDDGSRLFVNGQELVNSWQDGYAATNDGSISLTAGQAVPIEIDYYQDGGGSELLTGVQAPDASSPITQAAQLAAKSSVAIVFASYLEGEATDLSNIDLPGLENPLIQAVAAANPNTIVVLNTGSAVTMPWLSQVAGVMEAWYPGQQDGASVASLLFGDSDPSGKLPVTFPKSLADVPASTTAQWPGTNGQVQYSEGLDVGYRWYDAKNVAPLFPFGFGLSYTTFSFSNENLSAASGSPSDAVTVTADVTNTGSRAGSEVAQLYLTDPASAGEPPLQLKGFQKVSLAAGQTQPVSFTVPASAFQAWSDSSSAWTTAGGTYQVRVGDSSANLPLSAPYAISGTGGGGGGSGSGSVNVTASQFSSSNSVGTETTTDTGGGQDVGWINNSSWLEYTGVNFGSGLNSVTARIASPLTQSAASGEIQFRLDSLTAAPFATIQVTDTGGWQNWVTTPAVTASPAPSGTHTLYVTFSSGQSGNFVNVNDFTLGTG
ncbi:MAG: glycoside hydrolase family 3 C-terminal domain-containing protein [Streptosporangiaceae bacterium]